MSRPVGPYHLGYHTRAGPLGALAQQVWAGTRWDGHRLAQTVALKQKEAKSGSTVSMPSSRHVTAVPRPVWSAWAIGKPMSMTSLRGAARRAWVVDSRLLESLCQRAATLCVGGGRGRCGPAPPARPASRPTTRREATLALRYCPLTLCPPQHRKAEGLPAVTLWAVQVSEVEPPAETGPIEWLLLTTVAVERSTTPSSVSSGTLVAGALKSGTAFEKWVPPRSAAIPEGRALTPCLGALQCPGLADFVRHHAGTCGS